MKKRLVSLVLVIAMLLSVCTIPAVAKTLPLFAISDESVSVGDVFSVDVTLTENSSICGGGFSILYDNTKLEIINVSIGDIIRAHNGMAKKDYADNKVRVTWAGITPITSGGVVCTLEFKALRGYGTTSPLEFENLTAYDYNSKAITTENTNGTVTIAKAKLKPTLTLAGGDTVAGGTANITVSYSADDAVICGGSFEIVYDSSKLEAVAVTGVDILGETSYVTNLNYAVNKVKINFASSEPVRTGKLCDISFKVRESAYGSTDISVSEYDFYDADLNGIMVNLVDTTFEITALDSFTKPLISVITKDVSKNENADVCISVTGASDVCGGSFNILYDKNLFELISAEKSEKLGSVIINTTYADGVVRVSWASEEPLEKDGEIIRLLFKPAVYTETDSEIILSNTELFDSKSNPVAHVSANGIVEFVNKEIKVSEVEFTDSMGIKVESLQPGEININVNISNNSEETIAPVLYVALYDNNALSELKSYSLPEGITTEAVGTYNVTASVPENINEKKLKVFIWKNASSVQPLSAPAELISDGSYISIGLEGDTYAPTLKGYVISEEISEIKGKVFTDSDIEKIEYTVCDEYNNTLLEETANAGKEFSLSPIGFVVGSNILTVSVTEKGGNVINKSVRILNTNDTNMQALDNSDDDGDLLINCLEIVYGTDKDKADSDDDGITDYNEIMILSTNPLVRDSNNNAVSDADEDFDADGISNKDEFTQGTNPVSFDSDKDGLSDGEEINTYSTLPLNSDTDSDGVSDGTEVTMNTNPLEEQQMFNIEYLADNGGMVSAGVNMELSGLQVETLSITPVENDSLLNENIPGYMGSAYDFSVDGEFESATIGFSYDESLLSDDAQPAIFYYDEELQMLEELETTVLNGKAYAEVSHFSKYILLNKTDFDKVWTDDIRPPDVSGENTNLDIVLVIDSSGSMYDNDYENLRLSVAKEFVSKLSDTDRAAIVDFDSSARVYSDFTSSKTELNDAIDRIDNSGGTSLAAGIRSAIDLFSRESYVNNSAHKYIVMLTDGDGTYNTSLTDEAKSKDIVIYTVGLGRGVEESVLRSIASGTDGKYFFASEADDLSDIFVEIGGETIDYSTDSSDDGISDGICDYYNNLIYSGKLRTGTGISFTGIDFKTNSDYDGDGLLNGQELKIVQSGNKVYMTMISDPTRYDTDGDTVNDCLEVEIYKSNPLIVSINKDTVGFVTNSELYMAYAFDKEVEEDISKKMAIFTGNFIYGSTADKVAIYKKALNKMFEQLQTDKEEKIKINTSVNLILKLMSGVKKVMDSIVAENLADNSEKLEALKENYSTLLKAQEDLKDIGTYEGLRNISDSVSTTYNEICDTYGKVVTDNVDVSKMDIPIGFNAPAIKEYDFVKDLSVTLEVLKGITTVWNFIDSYSELSSKTEIISDNINILDSIILYSSDAFLVQAATELKVAANNELGKVLAPLKDVIVNAATGKFFADVSKAAACFFKASNAARASLFWAEVAKVAINVALGISETTEKAVQVQALSRVSEILKTHLLSILPEDSQNFYAVNDENLYYFNQLAKVRVFGEKLYVDMRKASIATVVLWNDDYQTAKKWYNMTCTRYENEVSVYFPEEIEKRKIQVIKGA